MKALAVRLIGIVRRRVLHYLFEPQRYRSTWDSNSSVSIKHDDFDIDFDKCHKHDDFYMDFDLAKTNHLQEVRHQWISDCEHSQPGERSGSLKILPMLKKQLRTMAWQTVCTKEFRCNAKHAEQLQNVCILAFSESIKCWRLTWQVTLSSSSGSPLSIAMFPFGSLVILLSAMICQFHLRLISSCPCRFRFLRSCNGIEFDAGLLQVNHWVKSIVWKSLKVISNWTKLIASKSLSHKVISNLGLVRDQLEAVQI